MSERSGFGGLIALTGLVLGLAPAATAQAPDPDPERFSEDFAEFAHWDAQNSYPEDAVLFVGSSSIVRWNTADYFPGMPVINRGFGGSHASDATYWLEKAVLKYHPALVVYYEGDNDMEAGKEAPQIVDDIEEFGRRVLASDPDVQVVFVSIKPSPRRWRFWSEMQVANAALRTFTESDSRLHFVDVGPAMLGPDGEPNPALFVPDRLHLTPAGYDVWTKLIGGELDQLRR